MKAEFRSQKNKIGGLYTSVTEGAMFFYRYWKNTKW